MTNCDGSQAAVVSSSTCIIDVLNLRNVPFSLEWGSHVYAKLRATNVKGSSTMSNLGDGGFIVTFADPPINFQEDLAVKSPTTIGLAWTEAAFNGGESVDNYRIYIQEQGQSSWTLLVSDLVANSFAASSLEEGVTYSFKVQAQNQHGYSSDSEILTIKSAFKPEPPTVVTTSNNLDHVLVDWNDPDFNGDPITAYSVFVLHGDGLTYSQESVDCDGTASEVVSNTGCIIYLATL
jgi:hypothetical protein